MNYSPVTGDSIMFLIKFPEKETLYPIKVKFQSRRYLAFLKAFGERLVGTLSGMSFKKIYIHF